MSDPRPSPPAAVRLRPAADGGLTGSVGPAEVRFTGRLGGVSVGAFSSLNLGSWTADDPDAVRENRTRLAAHAGVGRERLAQARQVHGSDVVVVTGDDELPGPDLERVRDADGVATALSGTPCVVLCADCLPVAFVTRGAVAMVHAGWRGLVGGVLEAGAEALRSARPAAVGAGEGDDRTTAIVGPGAGPCCYEVGDEVHEALAPLGPTVRRGRNADLPEAARLRLTAAGVDDVVVTGVCTICAPGRFFSHRRDAGATGRQAGAAWLR